MRANSYPLTTLTLSIALLPSILAATITAPPRPLLPRQSADAGSTSCDLWLNIEASCTSATPNFVNLAFSSQASCVCYSSSVWQPSVFDNALDTCLSYLSTASPAQFSSISGNSIPTNPCALEGNILAGSTTPAITSGSSTTTFDANYAACSSWQAIEASCSMDISSFSALPFTTEASCLCYTGTSTYAPSIFDGYWSSCLDYYQTASPAFYSSSLHGDMVTRTPCAAAGNVLGTAAATSGVSSLVATSTAVTATAPATTTASGTTTSTALTTQKNGTSGAAAVVRAAAGLMIVVLAGLMIML